VFIFSDFITQNCHIILLKVALVVVIFVFFNFIVIIVLYVLVFVVFIFVSSILSVATTRAFCGQKVSNDFSRSRPQISNGANSATYSVDKKLITVDVL
jgi:fatty acid desaturase